MAYIGISQAAMPSTFYKGCGYTPGVIYTRSTEYADTTAGHRQTGQKGIGGNGNQNQHAVQNQAFHG